MAGVHILAQARQILAAADNAGPEPAEVLMLFGPQGERMHLRARPRTGR